MLRIPAVLAAFALALTAGCATVPHPDQLDAQLKNFDQRIPELSETVGHGLSHMSLEAPLARPIALSNTESEPLPSLKLAHPLRLDNALATEALAYALMGTGVEYMFMPGAEALAERTATASGIQGSLAEVLDGLAELYGFFWTYRSGALRIEADREFLLEVPPIDALTQAVERTLKERGASRVSVDAVSGQVSYRATRPVAVGLERYLSQVLNQPLLVYEMTILEVRLNSGQQTGIQWNKFEYLGTGPLSATFNGVQGVMPGTSALSVTGVLNRRFSIDLLLRFLATQGTVKAVGQPKVQLLSGGQTELKMGETLRYVSKIGASAIDGSSAAQTTAEVTELDTGVMLKIGGRYWQGTVVTQLEIELSELLGFDSTQVGASQILKLPRIGKRTMGKNVLRLRPGEPGMLFGAITTREADRREALTNIPLLHELTTKAREHTLERNELVVVLVPRVIHFVEPTTSAEGVPQ